MSSTREVEEDEVKKGMMGLLSGRKPQDVSTRSKVSELFGSSSEEEDVDNGQNSSDNEIDVTNRASNKHYSSSSSSEDEDEYTDEWGPDLMGDEEDRTYLSTLPEIEREAILYERAQIRQTKSEKRDLERKMKELERRSTKQSEPSRPSSKNKKHSSLDALKKARMDKAKRRQQKGSDDDEIYQEDGEIESKKKLTRRSRTSSSSSSDSASSASDYDEDDVDVDDDLSYNNNQNQKDDNLLSSPISLEDANSLLLKRNSVAKWIYHPQFADLSRGMLLRLAIGIGKDGSQVYRVVEIREVVDYHRQYKINDLTTKKAALLRYGKQERIFRLDVISNSPITQSEFQRWMEVCKEDGLPVLNKYSCKKRHEAYYSVIEGVALSDDVVTKMIAAKKESLGIGAASRNLIAEREILVSLKNEAIASGMHEEIERITKEIELIDKDLPSTSAEKQRTIYKKSRLLDPSSKDDQGGELKHDPFSRRRCQPTNLSSLLSSANGSDELSSLDEKEGNTIIANNSNNIISNNGVNTNTISNTNTNSNRNKKLSDAHDFEFDI